MVERDLIRRPGESLEDAVKRQFGGIVFFEPPPCWMCKHYKGLRTCDAFPDDNIPQEIYGGYNLHRKPYPGDHNIKFE